MDMYQMNRQGSRPYTRTCGMNRAFTSEGSSGNKRNFMPGPSCCNRKSDVVCPMDERSCPASGNPAPAMDCNCRMPGTCTNDAEMYSHLQHLVPAMAYVPCQEMTETFDLCYALKVGTIFPQLCKPFCGKRGGCR